MAKLIDLKNRQRKDESEETKVDEMFDSIIEKNRQVKERMEKQRAENNRRAMNRYKIKGGKK